MSFTLSSSSESEDDDDRPVSYARDTEFIRNFRNGRHGVAYTESWPNEYHINQSNHFAEQPHANSSMHTNGFGNTSILDSSAILNTPPEDFVLIREGDKYRQVRVISPTKLHTLHATLPIPLATPDHKPLRDNIKIESPPDARPEINVVEIPLERNDFISLPVDPRESANDYCYTPEDDDFFPWTLPLPRFYPEVIRQIERNINQERQLNGKPKLSYSVIKDRVLHQTQRIGMVAQRRVDPRLERTLFPAPPQKLAPSSSSLHNQSVPNLKTSIFDVGNGEDAENAEDGFSDSSSSLSFSSSANESGPSKRRTRQNKILSDDSSDDEILTYGEFDRRNKTTGDRPNSEKKKITPIKIDLKNSQRNNSHTAGTSRNLLLEEPPIINKDDILKSLTDSESDDDDLGLFTPVVEKPKANDIKVPPVDVVQKVVTKKTETKVETKKTETKKSEIKKSETKKTDSKSSETKKTSATKRTVTKRVQTKEVETKKKFQLKLPPRVSAKKKVISAISRVPNFNKTDPGIARTAAKASKSDDANASHVITNSTLVEPNTNATNLSSKNSDASTLSTGSLEQRLSEIVSPIKGDTKNTANHMDEMVADVLAQPESNDTKTASDHNSSTKSEPSPPFESIIDSEAANQFQFSDMDNSDLITDSSLMECCDMDSNDDIETETKKSEIKKSEAKKTSATKRTVTNRVQTKEVPVHNDTIDSLQLDDFNRSMLNSTAIDTVSKDAINSSAVNSESRNDEPDTTLVPMDIEPEYMPFVIDPINNNMYISPLDIGMADAICENISLVGDSLDPSALIPSISSLNPTERISPKKNGVKNLKKIQRVRILITDMDVPEISTNIPENSDFELSDEDFEDDVPLKMDDLTLPNSNTDRNAADKINSECVLCVYKAEKGWKQLTKHYVRKHPNCEIPISRLAKNQDSFYLSQNPFTPEITKDSTGLMIKSHCPICDEVYGMSSEKWLMHFIAHTGEYEFRCNKCHQQIAQDLHKKCQSKGNERINRHSFVEDCLYGYVCMQCNYIQLSKENIKQHLDREHQQKSIATTKISPKSHC